MTAKKGNLMMVNAKPVPSSKVTVYEIIRGRGPSDAALMTALFHAYDDRQSGCPAIWVTFCTKNGLTVYARVQGLRHESGNNESWIVEGELSFDSPQGVRYEFTSYYNSRAREGDLRVLNRT